MCIRDRLESGQKTLIDRPVSKKDVADAVVFLCSEQGHAIRGQVIVVDGGASLKVIWKIFVWIIVVLF